MQHLKTGATLQSGKYEILSVLGQGGFGITYLAVNTMLDGKVAIKEFFFKEYCNRDEETSRVSIPTDGNREFVERFKQKFIKEARTIFKLNHPNIIRILDVFEENGTAYYVMEYIEGESLGDSVKRLGALPEAEAIGYIHEAGSALTYIQSKNLNHLDIKPGNLMKRRDNNRIQVIDFGVAKQYDVETSEGTTTTPVGISHGYSPSEQYQKNGVQSFSPQSDVYALAATLYKLLTGITPPEAMIVQDEGLPLEELCAKGVSEGVIRAIDAAMQTRTKRTQSVVEFLGNLDANNAEEAEDTLLAAAMRKADEERRRQEAEARRQAEAKAAAEARARAEAERRRQAAETERKRKEAERKAQEEVEQKAKAEAAKRKRNITIILSVIGVAVIGAVFFILGGMNKTTKLDVPTEVKEKTIVLARGHESKRNYVYTGAVDANGVPEGQGTAQYPETKSSSSSTFTGTFAGGIPTNGELAFSSGVKYKGEFDADGYYTTGTFWDADGYYFVGTFSKGQPYNGTWYDPQGAEDSKVINGK